MLYTRKGDDGTSGLFDTKERFPKDSPVYEALGTVDELNSLLGLARSRAGNQKKEIDIAGEIKNVQERLFVIQAELAGAEKSISETHIDELEEVIERVESRIENPHAFVIPGATELSALIDYARTVARRAERAVISASAERDISPQSRKYLNRLSSFLYALARYTGAQEGGTEQSPSYQ